VISSFAVFVVGVLILAVLFVLVDEEGAQPPRAGQGDYEL
jgi:hypothetical protein